jgi:hypothetical protein
MGAFRNNFEVEVEVRSDVALQFSLNKRPTHLHLDLEVSWTLEVNVRGQGQFF